MGVRAPASRRFPEQAEERLLVEAAQKDPSRFAELYEINFERVYAFVARRVGDRDAAEDLTSEVFHKALANLRRFEWRGVPFAAWLLRIAGNAIADQTERAGKELTVDDPPELGTEASALVDLEEVEHRAVVSLGGWASCGSAVGDCYAVCGGEEYSGDRGGARTHGRCGEAGAVPGIAESAGAYQRPGTTLRLRSGQAPGTKLHEGEHEAGW